LLIERATPESRKEKDSSAKQKETETETEETEDQNYESRESCQKQCAK